MWTLLVGMPSQLRAATLCTLLRREAKALVDAARQRTGRTFQTACAGGEDLSGRFNCMVLSNRLA